MMFSRNRQAEAGPAALGREVRARKPAPCVRPVDAAAAVGDAMCARDAARTRCNHHVISRARGRGAPSGSRWRRRAVDRLTRVRRAG